MGQLTTITGAPLCSFRNAARVPIESLKIYFNPVQDGSGDPSPTNIRAISGWDSIDITQCGKNLYNTSDYETGYIDASGTVVPDASSRHSKLIPVKSGFICIFAGSTSDVNNKRLHGYNKDGVWVQQLDYKYVAAYTKTAFVVSATIPSNVAYVAVSHLNSDTDLMVIQTTDQEYQNYDGTTTTITLPSTYYGGYVDLANGELVVDMGYREYNGGSDEKWNIENISIGKNFYINIPDATLGYDSNIMCSAAISRKSGTSYAQGLCFISSLKNFNFAAQSIATNVSELRTWLSSNPIQVAYKLSTPITYHISAQTVNALCGYNNIWSIANDKIECTYPYVETTAISRARQNIIFNSPHIKTASAPIVSFNTDLKAPIKFLKAEFSPIQDGSGDPSPSNIRPITGWTGISVTKCGKNLFDFWANGYWGSTNKTWNSSSGGAVSKPIYMKTGTVITLSQDNNNATYQFHEWNKIVSLPNQYTSEDNLVFAQSANGQGKTYTVQNDCYLTVFVNIGTDTFNNRHVQLEIGSIATSYEPYSDTTYPITWSELGTIYGGYVDLIAGTITATHAVHEMDGVSSNKKFSSQGSRSGTAPYNYYWNFAEASDLGGTVRAISESELIERHIISTHWPNKGYQNVITVGSPCFGVYIGNGGNRFQPSIGWPYDSGIDTVKKANAWLKDQYDNGTPFCFSYPLRTPVTYTLSSTTLHSLRGTNNIWSNANDNIEIKYWAH